MIESPTGSDASSSGAPATSSPERRASDRDPSLTPHVPHAIPIRGSDWRHAQSLILVISDTVATIIAVLAAFLLRFGTGQTTEFDDVAYGAVGILIVGMWLLLLANAGCYESRFLGAGTEEFKRVMAATVRVFAGVAVVSYVLRLDIGRGYIAIALPLGFALLLLARYALRLELQHARRSGRAMHRVVVVGDRDRVAELATQLRVDPNAGFAVVGACLPDGDELTMRDGDDVPVLGGFSTVADAVSRTSADTVAITGGPHVTADLVRNIAWSLEGRTVDLVVAPAIIDVAGPRITMRPVSGLPLIYVEEPEFTGIRRVLKRGLDVVGSAVGLVLLSPVLLVVAILVRTTSRGPALFKQPRVGREGNVFEVYKFRTMKVGAQAEQDAVWAAAAADGSNNKAKNDPRITPIGKFLRRWSVDELPQLINVLTGQMSLVGPRPMQPGEVDELPDPHLRRHLSEPGITGLWQVSGRSDTTWEERMRLDLYYVENWSLGLDVAILVRTIVAVVRGGGAY